MSRAAALNEAAEPAPARDKRAWLRVGLLIAALLIGLIPTYRFVGSMLWFREYLGDFQVFWGIGQVPLRQVYDHHVFAYPPSALLLFRPFGTLPFWPALVAWSGAGALAIIAAGRASIGPKALAIGFATYAGIGVLVGGQISFFIAALVMAALTVAGPRRQGVLLAVAAVIKPQSVIAAPIALLATRNWRAIGWAIGAGCGLLLLFALLYGPDMWLRWMTELPRFRDYLTAHGIDRLDVGLYGLARGLGLPGALFVPGVALGIAASWIVFRADAPALDRYAAFAISGVLMSPYTLYYDLAGVTFVCVAFLLDRQRSPLTWCASAMVVSSIFAVFGILLLAVILVREARSRQQVCASFQTC